MSILSEVSAIESLREYLRYLIESDVHDVCLNPVSTHLTGPGSKSMSPSESTRQESLEEIEMELKGCTGCGLSECRNHIVFGSGNQRADILFVIDGPNAEEDESGKIIQGESGKKLEEIIEKGMNLSLAEVYICPLVKCRPSPQGRALLEDEIQSCMSVFNRQLAVLAPKVIIALGGRAAQILLGNNRPIEQLRGIWHTYREIPVMPTYHPAYVLENYTVPIRKQVWNDVREVIRFLSVQP